MEFETDLNKFVQVLRLAKTPSLEEFIEVAKTTAIGITLVGSLGFAIFYAMKFLPV